MARTSYLWDEEAMKWAPRHEVLAKRAARTPNNRSSLSGPLVIGAMPETRSPIDGRIYTDKSSYYKHVERNNCAIVGFDKNWTDHVGKPWIADEKKHEADVVADVKQAIEMVSSNGGVPHV